MTVQPARSISAMAGLLAITACNKAEKRTMPSERLCQNADVTVDGRVSI